MKNNLTHRLHVLVFCLAPIFSTQAQTPQPTKINFLQNDLASAKTQAASAEKLILLKFSAKWCLPCRVMDEQVWTIPALAETVGKTCVAVAADVENVDGLMLKQEFLVETLPTILLMNACGEVLVRFETACSAAQILEQIRFYDTPENRFCSPDPLSVKPLTDFSVIRPPAQPQVLALETPVFRLSKPVFRSDLAQNAAVEVKSVFRQDETLDLPQH